MATVAPAILRTFLVRAGDPTTTASIAKEAFPIEMLTVAEPTAAAHRLLGSVPDARADSTPVGNAT